MLFAKFAGEYILKLLPRGTHDWRRFITPAELAGILARHRTPVEEMAGAGSSPVLTRFRIRASPWFLPLFSRPERDGIGPGVRADVLSIHFQREAAKALNLLRHDGWRCTSRERLPPRGIDTRRVTVYRLQRNAPVL